MQFRRSRQRNPQRPWRRRAPRRRQRRRDWLRGTLVELDPRRDAITLRVESGGRPIPARGDEVTIDVGPAVISANDGDGDGRASITDLFPGDDVEVTLWPNRSAAQRVALRSPAGPAGGLRPLWHA